MKIPIHLNLEPLAVQSATCVRASYHPAIGIGTLDTIAVWRDIRRDSEDSAILWAKVAISDAQSAAQSVVDQWNVEELT